jgi:ribose transport system permease protein
MTEPAAKRGNAAAASRPAATVESNGGRRLQKPSMVGLLVFARDRGMIVMWLILIAFFAIWAAPTFGTFTNATLVANAAAITAIFAAGVGFGVLTGLLDLSLPGTAAVAGIVTGKVLVAGAPAWLAIVAGLAVGPVVGVANALFTLRGLNSLVVTIGTLSVLTGLASVLSGGVPVNGLDALHFIGTDRYFNIPAPVYVAAVLFIIGTIFMTQTRAGTRMLSVGGNAEAVRRVGLNANMYTTLGFILISTCAALGGIVIASFVTSASPTPSTQVLFEALTAVALSGMPLSGGRGSLPRVLVGALIIQTISSGLVIKNVQPYWSVVCTGALLLIALLLEKTLSVAVANRLVDKKPPTTAPLTPVTADAIAQPPPMPASPSSKSSPRSTRSQTNMTEPAK